MSQSVPHRRDLPIEATWNAESVFSSPEAWEAEYQAVSQALPDLTSQKGTLASSAALLADALALRDHLFRRIAKVGMYAGICASVDAADAQSAAMNSRARGLWGRALAAASFIEPELLGIGQETLNLWMQQEPRLAVYAHYVDDLFRKQAHVRSDEIEEVLGMLADPFSGAYNTVSMLTDADFKYKPAITAAGGERPLTDGTYTQLMSDPDREVRRTAWENLHDQYLAYKNTLASNLTTSIKQNVFMMRARRHDSTLAASLFQNNIPTAVFTSLIETFQRNLPTWHRYWRIRRRALGVDALYPYDVWAPLTATQPVVPFEQAVEWIVQGMAPLGEEYVSVLRRGCLEQRWVDRYPNVGKGGGAFSYGSPGTHPFIVMNYADTIFSLSTLAHELGHSMHSYLTWQHQPDIYTDYSLFAAEVASNFNQAMVRGYLLNTMTERDFQIAVIEEAMSNFHRYFLQMPTLARFELEMHERVERGEGLTADLMNERMADLFAEAYGSEMQFDRQRTGITWATFSHLYADYYVYAYATGISAANALARRILAGQPGAAESYLRFLSAGGSVYPLDALKLAGLDMTRPEPVEEAFAVLSGLVDRLEALV